ncbi:hypothetical protein ACFQ3Z_04210 [Streptomyces nogalater]
MIVGANPTVARAAASLPGESVHVQLPGAPALDPGTRVLTTDFRDLPAFLTFTDEVLRPLRPAAVVSLTEFGLERPRWPPACSVSPESTRPWCTPPATNSPCGGSWSARHRI